MNKTKLAILEWIFAKHKEFFERKVGNNLPLKQLYNTHKQEFEQFLIEDFTGYIPKEVNEPAIKIIKEQSEPLKKWILWQSHIVNKKLLNDAPNILKWQGMMLNYRMWYAYLDTIDVTKQVLPAQLSQRQQAQSKTSEALLGVKDFINYEKETPNQDSQNAESKVNN
jgi:hypothetical protein